MEAVYALVYAVFAAASAGVIAGALSRRRGWVAAFLAVAAEAAAVLALRPSGLLAYHGLPLLVFDKSLDAAAVLLLASEAAVLLGLRGLVDGYSAPLAVLASLGGLMVLYSASVPVLVIGLEACAASVAGMLAAREGSASASARYMAASLFASAFIVLGGSLLWASGVTQFSSATASPTVILGFALLIAGLAVEIGLAPFHLWLPDVAVSGSRLGLSVAALAVDAPILLALYRVVAGAGSALGTAAESLLMMLAVASMAIGEFSALVQRDVRRMIGFNMVSDAGYMMLLGLAEAATGKVGLLVPVYFVTASNMAISLALASTRSGEAVHGASLAAGLLCVAGVPPFYGFAAKLAVVAAFARAGLPALAVLAAAFFLVSAAYNVRYVLVNAGELRARRSPWPLLALALLLLALGFYPHLVEMMAGW